jgi:hypothetical protein
MAEIADNELAILRRAYGLLDTLYADKDVGLEFKQMLKKKYPNASVPEIDAAAPHVARLEAFEKKFDDFVQRQQEREQDTNLDRSFAALRDAGYTDDGIEAVKKLMVDKKIPDPEVAAAYFDKTQPKSGPSRPGYSSSRFNIIESEGENDESFKQLMSDPEGWLENEVTAVLSEK